MSLGQSIGSSLGRAIGGALSGGGWSPLSLFQSGEQGVAYDAMDLSSFYSDDALTTQCAVNATCGSWRDVRGLYKAYQSTSANRPILRGTPTGANAVTNGDMASDARRNLAAYTQAFDNAAWTANNTTVTANTTVAPDGTTTADTITVDISSNANRRQSVACSAVRYTFTLYLRAGTDNAVSFGIYQSGWPAQTGTIISGPGTLGGGSSYQTITGLSASEWTRVAVTTNAAVSAGTIEGYVYPGGVSNTAGDTTIIWGAQLEAATAATDYQRVDATLWNAYWTAANATVEVASNVATWTASSSTLTHTLAATSGRVYRVRYTMTRSAGTLTPSFGGVTLTARSTSGTYEEWITASSTAALVFTGAAFTGTLDDVVIHDCSADVVTAPYGLQMGTVSGVDRWMQTTAVFAHDSDWSTCVGIRSYAFADGVYPYGVVTVRGGTSDTEGFILAVASGADVRTRAYSTESGFTKTLSAANPHVVLASKQQAAHVRTAWVSGHTEESDATAFATTPAATSNQSARFGLNHSTQFMPMIWYGGVLIGRELTAVEKAIVRQWVSARTPGSTL